MKKIKTPLMRETIFKEIRKQILFGEMKPGQKIIEMELAEQLGVSRTPVREALHKLELERLVKIVPRKHCIVIGLTNENIKEIHMIRSLLEPVAASKAAEKITDEELDTLSKILDESEIYFENKNIEGLIHANDVFHNLIIEISESPRIIDILENLHDYVERFRYAFMSREDLAIRSLKEHREIFKHLKLRDSVKTREAVEKHLVGIFEYEDAILKDIEK